MILITKMLIENPNKKYTYKYFCELFESAKSSISEDINLVNNILMKTGAGYVRTIVGKNGGVMLIPILNKTIAREYISQLEEIISDSSRIINKTHIYTVDIFQNPKFAEKVGVILASIYANTDVDLVITIENKSVPLAYETAKKLGVQMVAIRNEMKIQDGPSISIKFHSKDSDTDKNLYLPIKSIKPKQKVIIINGTSIYGETIDSIEKILKVYDCEVTGKCVLIKNQDNITEKNRDILNVFDMNIKDEKISVKANDDIFTYFNKDVEQCLIL